MEVETWTHYEKLLEQRRNELVAAALGAALAPEMILSRREDVTPYECDGLSAYRARPMVVVLPRTEEQVADGLRACHRLGVPVAAREAGTGLSGGVSS